VSPTASALESESVAIASDYVKNKLFLNSLGQCECGRSLPGHAVNTSLYARRRIASLRYPASLASPGSPSMASPLGGMRLAPAADGPGRRYPRPRQCRRIPGVIEKLQEQAGRPRASERRVSAGAAGTAGTAAPIQEATYIIWIPLKYMGCSRATPGNIRANHRGESSISPARVYSRCCE
jgi:hypothetical protein